ncbi:MAG: hypothetical protein ACREBN_10090 [Burkholderiaceae bacterium]
MEFFAFWLMFAIVVGVAASSRGRSGFGWFLLAVVISPLIALLLVLVMPKKVAAQPAAAAAPAPVVIEDRVKCPECAELVLREAKKCKHCGVALVPQPVEPAPAEGAAFDQKQLPPHARRVGASFGRRYGM